MKIIRMIAALTALLLAGNVLAQDRGFKSLAGGLKARNLAEGSGPEAVPGQVATIHFIGWLDEGGQRGKELYNSRREGRPVSFVIGTDKVMPAWNAGVAGMRAGGKRMLLIPPAMGYGNRAIDGVVPANATLMFQIELLDLSESD